MSLEMNHKKTALTLRPATQDDYDFLWRLHRATMQDYVDRIWGWDDAWQAQRFSEHFNPAKLRIIMVNDVRAGCLFVERCDDLIFLNVIEIAPEFQNRGIGSRLIHDFQNEAEAQGIPVQLQVLRANPARRLYERLGFVAIDETETHDIMRWLPSVMP
jgi:ribosomal protein S18 acetylase RimI-like enzyme